MVNMMGENKKSFDFSKPANVKKLRKELGLSARGFGAVVGLNTENDNHGRTVRMWEAGDSTPSGVAQKVMQYISQGVSMDDPGFYKFIPEYVFGDEFGAGGEYIIRLHYPRFVAVVGNRGFPDMSYSLDAIAGEETPEYVNIIQIIDPATEEQLKEALKKAAVLFYEYNRSLPD